MNSPTIVSADRLVSKRLAGRLLSLLVLSAAIVFAAGCGKAGPKNTVSGKVTLNGSPVMGDVVFVGGGKEAKGPILNGEYTINDPPIGEVDVLVKGLEGAAGAPAGGLKPPPGSKGDGLLDGAGAGSAVPAPAKYSQPGSLPKFTVKGGKQTHDIDLKP